MVFDENICHQDFVAITGVLGVGLSVAGGSWIERHRVATES
jgi:hypothetical protein